MRSIRPLTRRQLLLGTAAAAMATLPAAGPHPALTARQTPPPAPTDPLTEAATGAAIFAYPLVLMDLTRQQLTAVPAPGNRQAPINQFAHAPVVPDHTFETVVSPNVDVLYSSAWLDLAAEPIVLSLPETGDRYYLMQIMDAWTNVFASPGTRTTGSGAGAFAIVGPNWQGTLPDDVEALHAPTTLAWIVGRIETTGEEDYPAVHAIQAETTLTPLSAWGQPYTPPAEVPVDPDVDLRTTPTDQIAAMDPPTFWTHAAETMIANPPAPADAPMVAALATLGIVPGEPLAWDALAPAQIEALEAGFAAGVDQVERAAQHPAIEPHNGWTIAYDLGDYGTRYLLRAGTAWVGLGANLPEDGIYPTTRVDSAGEPLHGANRYQLHFPAGQLPPVNGFWSLTLYNDRQHFVDNPIDRYAIRDSDPLDDAPDGGLTILLQHEPPPDDQQANWLPAPPDSFNLILRLYWPKPEALEGTWLPPAVERIG